MIFLFKGIQELDVTCESGILYNAIGCLNKTIAVDPCVGAERDNKADVGSFRGLNGADAPVVRGVNISEIVGSGQWVNFWKTSIVSVWCAWSGRLKKE